MVREEGVREVGRCTVISENQLYRAVSKAEILKITTLEDLFANLFISPPPKSRHTKAAEDGRVLRNYSHTFTFYTFCDLANVHKVAHINKVKSS